MGYTAVEIRDRLREYIAEGEARIQKQKWYNGQTANVKNFGIQAVQDVSSELNIVQTYKWDLTLKELRSMLDFVTKAIDLGFDGFVYFIVGLYSSSHGMWAYRSANKDPNGAYLYHTFRSDRNGWDVQVTEGRKASDVLPVGFLKHGFLGFSDVKKWVKIEQQHSVTRKV